MKLSILATLLLSFSLHAHNCDSHKKPAEQAKPTAAAVCPECQPGDTECVCGGEEKSKPNKPAEAGAEKPAE